MIVSDLGRLNGELITIPASNPTSTTVCSFAFSELLHEMWLERLFDSWLEGGRARRDCKRADV